MSGSNRFNRFYSLSSHLFTYFAFTTCLEDSQPLCFITLHTVKFFSNKKMSKLCTEGCILLAYLYMHRVTFSAYWMCLKFFNTTNHGTAQTPLENSRIKFLKHHVFFFKVKVLKKVGQLTC